MRHHQCDRPRDALAPSSLLSPTPSSLAPFLTPDSQRATVSAAATGTAGHGGPAVRWSCSDLQSRSIVLRIKRKAPAMDGSSNEEINDLLHSRTFSRPVGCQHAVVEAAVHQAVQQDQGLPLQPQPLGPGAELADGVLRRPPVLAPSPGPALSSARPAAASTGPTGPAALPARHRSAGVSGPKLAGVEEVWKVSV